MIKSKIRVPLLNANEPEARLVDVHVVDGQAVEKATRLFTIETTKAASDIEAPEAGFIRLLVTKGATLAVGDLLAVITETVEEQLEYDRVDEERGTDIRQIPTKSSRKTATVDLRITKPARALADFLGVDLRILPTDQLVTEDVVRRYAGVKLGIAIPAADKPLILIYGGGGHAKSVMEIVQQNKTHTIVGIVDDDQDLTGKKVLGIPVLGTRLLLPLLMEQGVRLAVNGVGGILDIIIRVKIYELLEGAGFSFPTLVHPRATIEPSAKVGEGVQVFANAYVGPEANLHPRCMINTNAVISHDCIIEAYTHIAPGALLAGHVHVGTRTLVGMGVTTAIGVRIGDGARIGNGAILLADVPEKTIIQAGRFWTGKPGTV
jgi:sugar O-acyltransferase (sialic acid O-acetyltransferase NeuD family)